jgi:hypothetical protein
MVRSRDLFFQSLKCSWFVKQRNYWILNFVQIPNGLTMECNAQDYWIVRLCPSSLILKPQKNTTFRKLVLISFSGEGRQAPTLIGPLERADLKLGNQCHWSWSQVATDGQSASMSWRRAAIRNSWPYYFFCLTIAGFLMLGALSDERMGL